MLADRALSMIHEHRLHLEATAKVSKWRDHSQAALDTVSQITVDISRSHRGIPFSKIGIVSPVCNYIIRHTLQQIYVKRYADSKVWFDDSDALRESLAKLNRRWSSETGILPKVESGSPAGSKNAHVVVVDLGCSNRKPERCTGTSFPLLRTWRPLSYGSSKSVI